MLSLSLSAEQSSQGDDTSVSGGWLYYVPWYHSEDLSITYKVPPALNASYKELRSMMMKRIVKRYVTYPNVMNPDAENKCDLVWISKDALSAMENRQLPMRVYGNVYSFSDLLPSKPLPL